MYVCGNFENMKNCGSFQFESLCVIRIISLEPMSLNNQNNEIPTESSELTKILDATEGLIRVYGVRSVSMDDIARKLGMSKKTLYVHIANKDELVEKNVKRHVTRERQALEDILKNSKNALDQMIQIGMRVQQTVQGLNPSLIFDLQKYHGGAWALLEQFQREVISTIITNNLQQGIKEELYRPDINIPVITAIYLGLMPVFSQNSELFLHVSHAELHMQFIKYHINGILCDKGRTLLHEYGAWSCNNSVK